MTLNASLFGLWKFGLFSLTDPKIIETIKAIEARLWVKTDVGGVARSQNDYYHQVSQDVEKVAGNPWFICTLWLAQWYAARAQNESDLERLLALLQWVTQHALPSGVLAEQVHPYTNEPISVRPRTWGHAAFLSTVHDYLEARALVS